MLPRIPRTNALPSWVPTWPATERATCLTTTSPVDAGDEAVTIGELQRQIFGLVGLADENLAGRVDACVCTRTCTRLACFALWARHRLLAIV